ncbi:hypothetical protein PMAYCL1PPCAC_01693, partial [Pristionchus mayeri]
SGKNQGILTSRQFKIMDDNEAFIEGEFLEEIVSVDDIPGSSHQLEVHTREIAKHSQRTVKKDASEEADDDEYEEEEVHGQIIQGDDGEFYMMMDEEGMEGVEVDDDPNNVEMMITAVGEELLVFPTVPVDPNARMKRSRPARTILQDTEAGQVEMIQFMDMPDDDEGGQHLDMAVGAITDAETHDDRHILHHGHGMGMEPMPQGMKLRRTRVYGSCRCSECGQTFVNTARLERHLAVHQVFGSFLCPLCGKTYKYEYNLFYHWRRTCRDLNELMSYDDRKTMDVNALRSLVDEVASKKQEYGPIEIGISRSALFQSGPLARLEMPTNPLGRRGTACRACGIVVHQAHLQQHLNLHRGISSVEPDHKSRVGGYYCDLCGLLFRQHFNLIKHWRTNCAEIQANLPENVDITLDDIGLKAMVRELLTKASTNEVILDAERQRVKMEGSGRRGGVMDDGYENEMPESRRERERDEADASRENRRGYDEGGENTDYHADEPGAVFADDFEDDEVHMLGEAAIVEGSTLANRNKWNMAGGPIQCTECFRSFANQGRLERHMAGFHASHGSHHCALCGNRFKYDYNLLYHYRKSCPYTKNFIDRDVRDQMDAASLRKLVRSLAQKDLKLTPQTRPVQRLPRPQTNQSNDALIRREMIRPILANAPAVLTQARRGMANQGKQCPICSIMFYHDNALSRHMSMRHGMEYGIEEEYNEGEEEQYEEVVLSGPMRPAKSAPKKGGTTGGGGGATVQEEALEEDEAPPTLEKQQPGEQAVIKQPPPPQLFMESMDHHHHLQHAQQMQHEEEEYDDVQEMYDRGELRDGDRIIIREGGEMVEYTVNDEDLEGLEGEDVERDEEAEAAAAYVEDKRHHRQQMPMSSRSGMRQQQHLQHGRSAGGRPSTSHAGRKRPREESIWDNDLLEDDEEMEELQRQVDQRRAEEAARDGSAPRGRQMPPMMHRRGV